MKIEFEVNGELHDLELPRFNRKVTAALAGAASLQGYDPDALVKYIDGEKYIKANPAVQARATMVALEEWTRLLTGDDEAGDDAQKN